MLSHFFHNRDQRSKIHYESWIVLHDKVKMQRIFVKKCSALPSKIAEEKFPIISTIIPKFHSRVLFIWALEKREIFTWTDWSLWLTSTCANARKMRLRTRKWWVQKSDGIAGPSLLHIASVYVFTVRVRVHIKICMCGAMWEARSKSRGRESRREIQC